MRRSVTAAAGIAPVALIGGWSWAQSRQPAGYRPSRDSISALAARGAADRGIMTAGLVVLGLCYLLSAAGFGPARPAGRVLLAVGGLATEGVAALPQPSSGHVPAASVAFVALALWPAGAFPHAGGRAGTLVLLALLGWLVVELRAGDLVGLSERIVAGAESLSPLLAAVLLNRPPGGVT